MPHSAEVIKFVKQCLGGRGCSYETRDKTLRIARDGKSYEFDVQSARKSLEVFDSEIRAARTALGID